MTRLVDCAGRRTPGRSRGGGAPELAKSIQSVVGSSTARFAGARLYHRACHESQNQLRAGECGLSLVTRAFTPAAALAAVLVAGRARRSLSLHPGGGPSHRPLSPPSPTGRRALQARPPDCWSCYRAPSAPRLCPHPSPAVACARGEREKRYRARCTRAVQGARRQASRGREKRRRGARPESEREFGGHASASGKGLGAALQGAEPVVASRGRRVAVSKGSSTGRRERKAANRGAAGGRWAPEGRAAGGNGHAAVEATEVLAIGKAPPGPAAWGAGAAWGAPRRQAGAPARPSMDARAHALCLAIRACMLGWTPATGGGASGVAPRGCVRFGGQCAPC